jgi:hypothetical protein
MKTLNLMRVGFYNGGADDREKKYASSGAARVSPAPTARRIGLLKQIDASGEAAQEATERELEQG